VGGLRHRYCFRVFESFDITDFILNQQPHGQPRRCCMTGGGVSGWWRRTCGHWLTAACRVGGGESARPRGVLVAPPAAATPPTSPAPDRARASPPHHQPSVLSACAGSGTTPRAMPAVAVCTADAAVVPAAASVPPTKRALAVMRATSGRGDRAERRHRPLRRRCWWRSMCGCMGRGGRRQAVEFSASGLWRRLWRLENDGGWGAASEGWWRFWVARLTPYRRYVRRRTARVG